METIFGQVTEQNYPKKTLLRKNAEMEGEEKVSLIKCNENKSLKGKNEKNIRFNFSFVRDTS